MNRIAQELIEISKLLIALDCKKFNDDYAKLMRQYHTMHGPGKRDMRKTLDVMEDRLRDDCSEKEEKEELFVRQRGADPDYLYRNSLDNDTSFVYFSKSGQLFEKDRWVHARMVHSFWEKLSVKALSDRQFKDLHKWLWYDRPTSEVRELGKKFPDAKSIRNNWNEFVKIHQKLGLNRQQREIVLGDWGEYGNVVILGRYVKDFNGDGKTAVSFWGKPSKSLMKRIAAKLKVDVKTIYLWN